MFVFIIIGDIKFHARKEQVFACKRSKCLPASAPSLFQRGPCRVRARRERFGGLSANFLPPLHGRVLAHSSPRQSATARLLQKRPRRLKGGNNNRHAEFLGWNSARQQLLACSPIKGCMSGQRRVADEENLWAAGNR